jgi:hypothetical protein
MGLVKRGYLGGIFEIPLRSATRSGIKCEWYVCMYVESIKVQSAQIGLCTNVIWYRIIDELYWAETVFTHG